jgi:hypothetical protein
MTFFFGFQEYSAHAGPLQSADEKSARTPLAYFIH